MRILYGCCSIIRKRQLRWNGQSGSWLPWLPDLDKLDAILSNHGVYKDTEQTRQTRTLGLKCSVAMVTNLWQVEHHLEQS